MPWGPDEVDYFRLGGLLERASFLGDDADNELQETAEEIREKNEAESIPSTIAQLGAFNLVPVGIRSAAIERRLRAPK
ncbi:MAG: hypothetical protein L0Y44_08865, partial [Phycisphaerales bacterium]|nr:hypothetical protein [Phycisphaerales bacterium]MCI0630747.1 hypothetical protein [Phycisphaerales bacterium]